MLCLAPALLECGHRTPIVVVTSCYAMFQAANSTRLITSVGEDQRGVVSGMLNLSRNLGLITGASVMGTLFATAGMRITLVAAAVLMVVAISVIVASGYAAVRRSKVCESCR